MRGFCASSYRLGGALGVVLEAVPERAVPVFLEHLLPPLPDELTAYRQAGSGYLANLDYKSGHTKAVVRERRKAIAQRLAPMLRDEEATERLLDHYEVDPPASRSNAVMHLINAIEDDEVFLKRLRARVKEWGRREVVLLLGRMGEPGLDVVREAVVRRGRDTSEGLAKALALVAHPVAADILVTLAQNPTSGVSAREVLLEARPAHVAGLLDVATGRSSRVELAESILQEIRRTCPEALKEAAEERADVDADRLDATVPEPVDVDLPELPREEWPDWLENAALDRKPKGLPRFLTNDFTPQFVTVGGSHILPRKAVYGMLAAARDLDLEPDSETRESRDGRPLLEKFAEFLDDEAATYGFRVIFDRWNQEGGSKRHDWCLRVMSIFGDDAFALDLSKWVDEWPKHGLMEIAETGIEVLAELDTDTSLMALNGIAQRGTFAKMRRWAQARLNKLAVSRGLGADELQDMVIDDCGLGPDGKMVFDYGTRSFELVFDAELKPRFQDEEGAVHRTLPRARKSDDDARVQAAKARYKLLRKRLSEVLKTQRKRLEDAMIDGRRWTPGTWYTLLVEHPLVTHLVQRLLWGAFEGDQLITSFRVDEARELVDERDESLILDDLAGTRIGVLHPLELGESERHRWAAVLGDYEIVAPFPQLQRPTVTLQEYQQALDELRAHDASPGALRGVMKRAGWRMGYPASDGHAHYYSRKFGRGPVYAWLLIEPGLNASDWRRDKPQRFNELIFTQTPRQPEDSPTLPPTSVSPSILTETLHTIQPPFHP